MKLAPGAADGSEGSFDLLEDSSNPDVIIVGSGISGLSSAFYLSRRNPKARILILDTNQTVGGNAGRDDASPIPVVSATGAAYAVAPYADFLHEFYREIGMNWEAHLVDSPFYSYFFDSQTPFITPGTRRWVTDAYGAGLKKMPYSPQIIRDLESARRDFMAWYEREGAPTDPPDASAPQYDYLDRMSFQDYLLKDRHYHPALSDFFTRFSIDALGGTPSQVSAHSAISFLGSEFHPIFATPGGNSGIARLLTKWLIPGSISGDSLLPSALDAPSNRVRIRQGATVLRADTSSQSASVVYFQGGKFFRAKSSAVVFASQGHSAQHAVKHLLDPPTQEAWRSTTLVPVAVANVTLKRAAPLVDLGLGYNQYWWGSKYWADFVIADWIGPRRHVRNRETVLTFYGGNSAPPEEMPVERMKLMTTPFADYEKSLREDLGRILGDTDFNFDQDVSAISLYRWGHGMTFPKPFHLFGKEKEDRKNAPRLLARKQLGRISFAGQDTEGSPSIECAIASGLRCSGEVLPFLG